MIDIAKDLYLEFFNSFQTYVARNIVSAPKDKAIIILIPPASHASYTGGAEIITVANPPSATKPIIPKLNKPA